VCWQKCLLMCMYVHSRSINLLSWCLTQSGVGDCWQPLRVLCQYEQTAAAACLSNNVAFVSLDYCSIIIVLLVCSWIISHAPHLWYPPFYTSPMASSALQHWTAITTKVGCHWQAGGENRQTWGIVWQAHITVIHYSVRFNTHGILYWPQNVRQ